MVRRTIPESLFVCGTKPEELSPPTTYLAREKYGGQIGGEGGQMGGAGTRKKGQGGTRDWSVVHWHAASLCLSIALLLQHL